MPAFVSGFKFTVHSIRKTINYKLLTINQFKKAYTLIEFLVVVGILIFVVGVTFTVLTQVLKGTNQANITSEVRQNGQVILDAVERRIRNSQEAENVAPDHIKLINGNSYFHIKCFDSTSPNANGWIGIADTQNINDDPEFTTLSNIDSVSGVDISPCSLGVLSGSSQIPDVVTISFRVNQGVAAPSRKDFQANVDFSTAISLRKY